MKPLPCKLARLPFDLDDHIKIVSPMSTFMPITLTPKVHFLYEKTAFHLLTFFLHADHFSQIEDDNGLLNFPKFEAYLRELLQVG